jgi:hypothetical protein
MATYVNELGQTVTYVATASGMLPTFDATGATNGVSVPNTAAAQPAPKATAADVAQAASVGVATTFAPQHAGTSGTFPIVHAT